MLKHGHGHDHSHGHGYGHVCALRLKPRSWLQEGKAKPSTWEKPILDSIARLEHLTMAMEEAGLN